MIRSLIQGTVPRTVHPCRDDRLHPRDESLPVRTNGDAGWTSGAPLGYAGRRIYPLLTIMVIAAGCVGAFSSARDIAWRMGAPHNLWEPALWESSSIVVIIALLPLAQVAGLVLRGTERLLVAGLAVAVLALVFSALHILGMGLMREWAYRVTGWHDYVFPWSKQIVYELRKDLIEELTVRKEVVKG